jgi:hypothetical protein
VNLGNPGKLGDLLPSSQWAVEQALDQLGSTEPEVLGDVSQDRRKCPQPKGIVAGNRHVVLPAFAGRESKVAAGLARNGVTQGGKRPNEVRA